jgi:hypothetical protein
MSWQNGDPAVSHVRGENDFAAKKGRYDGGYTPTEQRIKDGLMKQFCKLPEGSQNTAAYTSAECWCACGRLKDQEHGDKCRRCANG